MSAWALYLLLLRATLTSFSGFASVPVVRMISFFTAMC